MWVGPTPDENVTRKRIPGVVNYGEMGTTVNQTDTKSRLSICVRPQWGI
jgi:hypothetical protein